LKIVSQKYFNQAKFFEESKKLIDTHLDGYLKESYPQKIWEAMRYTVLSEGKRIRPVLALESAKACGGDINNVMPTACAIEMLHAQSLIHDDLPCMDNDDYRRGKLTNHRVFGEATAVLAGDALLAHAPYVILRYTPNNVPKTTILAVLEEFSTVAGAMGIVGGQLVDIESENKDIDISTFTYIHTHKTGELFKFAMRSGAMLSGANDDKLEALTEYGRLIGYAFQIADDVLDVTGTKEQLGKTPGKDEAVKKNTHVSLYGLAQSKDEVEHLCSMAQQTIINAGLKTPGLIGIAGSIALKLRS